MVVLPKTTALKDTCLAWTDFKQGWTEIKKITGLEAAAKLVSMNFTIKPLTESKAYFNIFRLRKNQGWIADINKKSWQYLNPDFSYGIMFDSRDSQYYKTTVIDGKTWMSENLNHEVDVTMDTTCSGNSPENIDAYGRLYTWDVAQTACPQGWRLPSREELLGLCGGAQNSAERSSMLRSKKSWDPKGSDETGLSAANTGTCYQGNFSRGSVAYWGSEVSADSVFSILIADFGCMAKNITKAEFSMLGANPVRCVRDD